MKVVQVPSSDGADDGGRWPSDAKETTAQPEIKSITRRDIFWMVTISLFGLYGLLLAYAFGIGLVESGWPVPLNDSLRETWSWPVETIEKVPIIGFPVTVARVAGFYLGGGVGGQ